MSYGGGISIKEGQKFSLDELLSFFRFAKPGLSPDSSGFFLRPIIGFNITKTRVGMIDGYQLFFCPIREIPSPDDIQEENGNECIMTGDNFTLYFSDKNTGINTLNFLVQEMKQRDFSIEFEEWRACQSFKKGWDLISGKPKYRLFEILQDFINKYGWDAWSDEVYDFKNALCVYALDSLHDSEIRKELEDLSLE